MKPFVSFLKGNYHKIREGLLKIGQFPPPPYRFKRIKISKYGNGEEIRIGYLWREGNDEEKETILKLIKKVGTNEVEVGFLAVSEEMHLDFKKFISQFEDNLTE